MKLKSYLEKGSGEVIGFLCILPIIIFMLVILVSVVQLGSIKERLEYTAYVACRKAIVVSDENKNNDYLDDALEAAQKAAEADLVPSGEKFVPGSVKVDLELVQKKDTANKTKKKGSKDSKAEKLTWEKGNYVQCTVSVEVKSLTPFLSGKKSASIVMMIEKPVSEGDSYPWFEHFR